MSNNNNDINKLTFDGNLKRYSVEDFTELVYAKFGWAVRDQAKDVLNGQAYSEQNRAALKMIQEFAALKKEAAFAKSIRKYLENSSKTTK